jgi:hypothetical protein
LPAATGGDTNGLGESGAGGLTAKGGGSTGGGGLAAGVVTEISIGRLVFPGIASQTPTHAIL